ncbi:MAG: MATE family efflux transporter [Sarcina sp.]
MLPNKKVLRKKFINYIIPSLCAMWVFSLYTIVDGIFVGRYVGPNALASINISMPLINLIFAISILFSIGSSTIISIYLGEGKKEKANSIFTLGLILLCIISFIVLAIVYIFPKDLAYFLGADSSTINYVLEYMKTIVFFNVFFMIAYYLEVLCKAANAPYLSIIVVSIAALTNIILDYIFVARLNFGVTGAAFATGIAQLISAIIFIIFYLRSTTILSINKLNFSFHDIQRIIKIGFPDSITEIATGVVILLFNKTILTHIGENGIISYGIISYINTFVIMSMIAITQGMQPLISYYLGKKNHLAIKYTFKLGILTISFASIIAVIFSIVFAPNIVKIFIDTTNIELYTLSIESLRLYALCFIFLGFNIIISGLCAAIEKPFFASIISFSRGFIIISICLILLSNLIGPIGIWISPVISEASCLLISIFILSKLNTILKIKEA